MTRIYTAYRRVQAPRLLTMTGLGLLALTALSAGLSRQFPYGTHPADAPLPFYIGAGMAAGGLFLADLWRREPTSTAKHSFLYILGIGLAMRLVMFASLPVLEDDSYRYLWDGAVVAEGLDPYTHPPAAVATFDAFGERIPPSADPHIARLQTLAEQHAETHARINHPYLTTIYPPVAQAAFATAHLIAPFKLWAWRLVLLFSEIAACTLLVFALKAWGRNRSWLRFYWWNPVVVVQGIGAGHMDLLLVPFILLAALALRANRPASSAAALSLAIGVKLWPVLLAPLFARQLFRDIRLLLVFLFVLGVLTPLLLAPFISSAFQSNAGALAYSTEWRTNSFLFALLSDGVLTWTPDPDRAARLCAAAIIGAVALWQGTKSSLRSLPQASLIIVSVLIFLSPAGYPWYLIWAAPLLALCPVPGVALLAFTLPLYQLRFPLGDETPLFQWGVVPLTFGLPLLVLLRSGISARKGAP